MLKWESLKAIKARFQYFAYWSDEQMIECGKLAKLRTFRSCEIIYVGDDGNSPCVYFVLSGECSIFQRFQGDVSKHCATISRNDSMEHKVANNQPKNHFLEIGTYSCGAVFGLGEPMDDRAIAAKNSGAQCLIVPRHWLFQKEQNMGNVWQRIQIYLVTTIPQHESVRRKIAAAEKWMKYKKCVIEKSRRTHRKPNSTKYEDIPVMCRVQHAYRY